MPTISEVRQKYPQYKDMSDAQLADALHAKFYADMPRDQFNAKIGLSSTATGAERWDPLGETVGAVKGAAKKFVDNAKADIAAQGARSRQPASAENIFSLDSPMRTARMAGDAINVAISPVSGAFNAYVSGPIGRAVADTGARAYAPTTADQVVDGFRTGQARAPRQKSRDATAGAVQEAVNTSVNGAMPGRGAVGFTGPQIPQGLARRGAVPTPNIYATRGAEFDRAGIDPSIAAVRGGGSSKVANAIAENPVAGARVRAQMGRQVEQAGVKARDLASSYGADRGGQIAGEGVQAGVTRFAKGRAVDPSRAAAPARETSFAAKAGKLYDDAFAPIEAAEEQVAALGNPTVQPAATTSELQAIGGRVNSRALSQLITDDRMKSILGALEGDAANVRFSDLRALRTWVREAKGNPQLRQGVSQGDLSRIESALTQDIYANAEALGGNQALSKLQRADAFYRAGSERINRALQTFGSANSGEQAYSRIIQAAGSTASADARKLVSLKRSLAPEEWGDVAATTLSNLGKPSAGAANAVEEGGFSINTFLTNYAKLSPAGREVIFGARGGGGEKAAALKNELDNLAKVAGYLKQVQKGANASNSGVSVQSIGTLGLLFNPKTAIPTAAGLGGAAGVGEILTNPAAVRWLARLSQAGERSPAAMAATVKRLETASKASVGLAPLLAQVKSALQGASMPGTAPAAAEDRN